MKICSQRREAISQSMDLFIIIAAVLGVGGIVSASIYNLIASATASTSIEVVEASLRAGSAAPTAVSVTVKNDGGSPIACAASACQVVVAGSDVSSPACTGSCLVSGGNLTWALDSASGPLTFTATGAAALAPGAETSFVVNGPIGGTGTFWEAGDPVTLNVIFGSASAQVTVISQ